MNVYLAEFIGTAILILFGNGVVANVSLNKSKAKDAGWIVVTAAWGFGVMFGAYSVGWISGAHLNPAVTIGFAVAGLFKWNLVLGYIIAQILGAMFGQLLVYLIFKLHYDESDDHGAILASFCTSPAIRNFKWNLVTEGIVTFFLVFGLLAAGNSNNQAFFVTLQDGTRIQGFTGLIGPMLAGFYIWVLGLSLGGPTGYAINPARDLGPRIMHSLLPLKQKGYSDWEYAFVPIVAPIIGGILGALAYGSLF